MPRMFYELTFVLDTLAHWTWSCKPELSADMLLNIMGRFKKVSPRSRVDCGMPGARGGGWDEPQKASRRSRWQSWGCSCDVPSHRVLPKPGTGCKQPDRFPGNSVLLINPEAEETPFPNRAGNRSRLSGMGVSLSGCGVSWVESTGLGNSRTRSSSQLGSSINYGS